MADFGSFVFAVFVVVRNIDVGGATPIGLTIVAGTIADDVDEIDTGKNADGDARNDAFDEFGDNGLNWYIWRFNVCVAFAGIKMWWVCEPDGKIVDGGDGDDWNLFTFPVQQTKQNNKIDLKKT